MADPGPKRGSLEAAIKELHLTARGMGVKKVPHARDMGFKRSRAAEVHKLSEKRRRDRINEKMRVLQELIPKCSKVGFLFKFLSTV